MPSNDTESPYQWSQHRALLFEVTVNAREFHRFLDPVASLVDEALVDISPNSLHARAMDPAGVAAVDVTVDCVEDADETVSAALHVSDLVENTPPYWGRGCTYTLELDHDPDGQSQLRVEHATEGEHESKVFPPDTARTRPDEMPPEDTDPEQDVLLAAPKVRGVLGALAETDTEYLRLTPRSGELRVEAVEREGHVQYEWTTSAPGVREGGYQYYSSDYVRKIADGLWPDGEMRVQFGEESPLVLTNGSLQFVQAPRTTPDFEEET